jgi:hypothetical protein
MRGGVVRAEEYDFDFQLLMPSDAGRRVRAFIRTCCTLNQETIGMVRFSIGFGSRLKRARFLPRGRTTAGAARDDRPRIQAKLENSGKLRGGGADCRINERSSNE